MKPEKLDSMSRLLQAERERPCELVAQQEEILARVLRTVGPVGPGSGSHGASESVYPTSPLSGGGASAKATTAIAGHGVIVGAAFAAIVASGVGVGVLASRFVESGPRPSPPAVAPSESAVPSPPLPATTAVSAFVEAPAPSVETSVPLGPSTGPPDKAQSTSRTAAGSADEALAAERRLLESARSALAQGKTEAALRAVDQHQRQFPRGRLSEERETLRVQALAAAGRWEEARTTRADFQKKYPESMLGPVVDMVVDASPGQDTGSDKGPQR